MTAARLLRSAAFWYGVFGAPLAWTLQHIAGYGLTVASCSEAGYDVHRDAWTLAITAAATLAAAGAGIAAVHGYRSTRDADEHGDPPAGRIHFLSLIGIAIAPLFMAMILMSGIGSVVLEGCRQS